MSDDAFEAHIKTTAWYGVLSQAANDDDDGASVFRMTRMAAHEAWNASRSSALEEAVQVVILPTNMSYFWGEASGPSTVQNAWPMLSALWLNNGRTGEKKPRQRRG